MILLESVRVLFERCVLFHLIHYKYSKSFFFLLQFIYFERKTTFNNCCIARMNVTIEDIRDEEHYENLVKGKSEREVNEILFHLISECLIKAYVRSPNHTYPHFLACILANDKVIRNIGKHVHGMNRNNPFDGYCMYRGCQEYVLCFRSCLKCKPYDKSMPGLAEGYYYNCRVI